MAGAARPPPAVQLTATGGPAAELLDLDWHLPLVAWTDPRLVRMARAPSRHLVRFVEVGERVYAVKELGDRLAQREWAALRSMHAEGVPVVEAVATVCERRTRTGAPLEGALVTRYLSFSLPYSYLLAQEGSIDQQHRLVDAAAVLLVTLHLEGFFWGDCSLGNMLFRRDAGALAAYLVDAETAESHERLSDGQRRHDLEIAVENVAGGVADLIAAGRLEPLTDPVAYALRLERRYDELWSEVTAEVEFPADEPWRVEERTRRLEALGFDVAEVVVTGAGASPTVRVRPTVVEEGHHARRLARLTGIEGGEGQARRLLDDFAAHRSALDRARLAAGLPPLPEALAAHRWMTERYEPFVAAIPPGLATRLEPAEAYHQYLDHRWYLSEAAGGPVPEAVARASFFATVLAGRPDEAVVLPDLTGEVPITEP